MGIPLRSSVGSRRGSIIFLIVIGSIIVLGVLGFSLYRSISEKASFVNAHTTSCLMDFAAFEVSNVVFESIGAELANPSGALFKQLVRAGPDDFPVKVSGLDETWAKSFAFSGRKEFAGLSCEIDARFDGYAPLAALSQWKDSREKLCRLDLTIDISLGRRPMRRLGKTYKFGKPCKVMGMTLPVVSKFTLFVSKPEDTSETAEGYNCFENFIDGRPAQSTKNLPLILFNSPDYRQIDLRKVGYVFLGGDKDLELHVTSGGDSEYGEFFHFFNINKPEIQPPLFSLNTLPDTLAFKQDFRLSDSPPTTAKLGLQGVLFGFYVIDNSNPPADMNYKNTLEKYFCSANSRRMKSSSLHLFGNIANPSPTIVLGRVKRVYPQYVALTADLDQDGRSDGILTMLRAPAEYTTSGGTKAALWDTLKLPANFFSKKKNVQVGLGSVSMQKIFETEKNYLGNSSRLVKEEANRAYDYLLDQGRKFPPPTQFQTKNYGAYLQTGEDFKLSHLSTGGSIFQGNLKKIDESALLTDRITHVVEDAAQFSAQYLVNGELDLRGRAVMVKKGPLELPTRLQVSKGGILVVKGEIKVSGGITCETTDVVLTLASFGGDIVLESGNDEVQAFLVALGGTIKPGKLNTPVKIKGGMAVSRLKPTDWPAGARITYDTRYDPSQAGEEFYTALLADFFETWSVDSFQPVTQ